MRREENRGTWHWVRGARWDSAEIKTVLAFRGGKLRHATLWVEDKTLELKIRFMLCLIQKSMYQFKNHLLHGTNVWDISTTISQTLFYILSVRHRTSSPISPTCPKWLSFHYTARHFLICSLLIRKKILFFCFFFVFCKYARVSNSGWQ